MRVLHILNELKYSGAEIMYVDAAPEFHKLGCELFVVNTMENLGEYSYAFEEAGYKVFHIPCMFKKGDIVKMVKWIMEMRKLIRDNKIDLIHIHAARLRFVMAFVAWSVGVPSIYTFHNVFKPNSSLGYFILYMQRIIVRYVFHCKMQTISDSVYINEKNIWKNETKLVYNWYGKQRFYPRDVSEYIQQRKLLGINEGDLVIISVGGCNEIKRHSDIIKAIPLLKEKGPRVIYLDLGEGKSLDEEKLLTSNLGIDNDVKFIGNRKNVRDFLVASDIYVMPSKHEGMPITTIEAMACKIPCVLYDVPGLRDFNKEKECSLLTKESPNELAEAIYKLWRNPNEQNRLTDNAFNFISKYFDLDKQIKKIYTLYTEAVEGYN